MADAPPIFSISARTGNFKYHALLSEPVWMPSKLLFDVRDEVRPERASSDGVDIRAPLGLYGFPRIEDRDKFIRRANNASGVTEYKVCKPVTLTLAGSANAQALITGPVAEDQTQE